jgi:hypothetical protein
MQGNSAEITSTAVQGQHAMPVSAIFLANAVTAMVRRVPPQTRQRRLRLVDGWLAVPRKARRGRAGWLWCREKARSGHRAMPRTAHETFSLDPPMILQLGAAG